MEASTEATSAATSKSTKKGKKQRSKSPRDGAAAATATTTASSAVNNKKKKFLGEAGSNNNSKRRKKSDAKSTLIDPVLYCLTEGIPRMELKAVIAEANDAEKELLQEIELLEQALAAEEGGAVGADAANETRDKDGQTSKDEDATNKINSDKTETNNNDGDTDSKAKMADDVSKNNANVPPGGQSPATKANNGGGNAMTVESILQNPFTPLDRCFTLSSLLGRLRDDLAMPSIRQPPAGLLATGPGRKKKANSTPPATYTQILGLASNPNYTRVHPDPPTQLLNVWRKIASHRTAMVFRKPVKPEEAPGYKERILFPMDLSLVRKMIVGRMLTTFAQVHQRTRLISHNCVKYNGRESDYGIVAREFEAVVDEYIVAAVHQQAAPPGTVGGKVSTSTTPSPTLSATTASVGTVPPAAEATKKASKVT